jgi:uncharacterized protein YjbJ (UPF0337 family)
MSPSNGAKVALAVGAGYLLGRTRKMRFALMLASAGMTGKFRTKPIDILADSLKSLGASEELTELTDQLGGQALNVAKAAALAAAVNRVNALNERLQQAPSTRVGKVVEDVGDTVGTAAGETVGDVGDTLGEVVDDVGDTVDTVGKSVKSVTGLLGRRAPEHEEGEEADLYEDEGFDDEEGGLDLDEEAGEEVDPDEQADLDDEPEPVDEEPQRPPRKRRAMPQPTTPKASTRRSARAATVAESPARVRRSRPATTRAPVRRGG